MYFAINGGFSPYLYAVLLQTSLFFLQRLNHIRRRSSRRGASTTANALIDLYCGITALAASILNWGAHALAIYIGYRFGMPEAVLFFGVRFLGSILLSLVVPPGLVFDLTAHMVSLIATPTLSASHSDQ
jgi:hypothetical protein